MIKMILNKMPSGKNSADQPRLKWKQIYFVGNQVLQIIMPLMMNMLYT